MITTEVRKKFFFGNFNSMFAVITFLYINSYTGVYAPVSMQNGHW